MGPKLLFSSELWSLTALLARPLGRQDSPSRRPASDLATCVQSPTPLPYFGRQRELLAQRASTVENEARSMRP